MPSSDDLPLLVGIEVLRKAGAATLHAHYAWENDEGQLSGPWAEDAQGNHVTIPPSLYAALDQVVSQELKARNHAYGRIRIDLDTLEGTHEGHA